MRLISRILATAAGLAMLATAAQAQVVVSSKIDTEGGLLGNVISQVLQANGIAVTEKIQLGATPVVRDAIKAGQIDIYAEYSGNGAFFLDQPKDLDPTTWADPMKGYEATKKADYEQNKIVWLTPSPANNTWAIAVREDVATPNNLKTLSDFAGYVNGGGNVKLVGSAEFISGDAGLKLIQNAYGFTLKDDQLISLSGGDTAATIGAAAQQTNGANAAMAYGTDGGLAASGLVVLDDDKGAEGVYLPTPIIREAVLTANPQIADLLKPVFEKLDLVTLQTLNGRIQVGGEPAKDVAIDWLKQAGFLK
jgi:osmoprotectant transport system substrate-binding protein